MAEGRSNTAIADALVISARAVEKHIASIVIKLDLPPDTDQYHRRVMAVVRYLNSLAPSCAAPIRYRHGATLVADGGDAGESARPPSSASSHRGARRDRERSW
jgi:hypothetical protein